MDTWFVECRGEEHDRGVLTVVCGVHSIDGNEIRGVGIAVDAYLVAAATASRDCQVSPRYIISDETKDLLP